MTKEVFLSNAVTGLYQTEELTHDGTLVIETKQDVEPILEATKALQNDEEYTKKGIQKGWWHVATIPEVLVHKWHKEGFNIFTASMSEIRKKLQSPEYAYFLTTTKKF
jgi:hypothetical protein